uniref:Uncharacterized protein n=1 Tax=Anguilla anguilla TaxID=7936 RepID=A0A0E9P910_ANGAN
MESTSCMKHTHIYHHTQPINYFYSSVLHPEAMSWMLQQALHNVLTTFILCSSTSP